MTIAVLVVAGLAGAAAAPRGGLLIGIPHGATVAGAAALSMLAARLLGLPAFAPAVGLLVPLVLLAVPRMPGASALSGPPLLALAAAGLVIAASQARRFPPLTAVLAVAGVAYVAVAFRVQERVGPHGDEPHYLMVAESLLRDHDLRLEPDYAERRYAAFTDGELAPHYRVRGRGGAIYSVHAIGLSLLVLPAYALGGYAGASFFMAGLALLLVREIHALLRASGAGERLSLALTALLALTPPLVQYVGLVFTEIPAALVLARALRGMIAPGPWRARDVLVWALPLCALPWFNVRYAPVTAIVLAGALAARPSARVACALAAPAVASAAGIMLYHHALYGFFDPRLVWGARPEFSAATLAEGLPGLALDQEFGLLPYAPVFAFCLPGLVRLVRERTRLAVVSTALALVVVGTAGSWHMWRGGFNPPARFLVPLVPVFALALARAFRGGPGAAGALVAGWGLWVGACGAWDPSLVHRDRDGTAPFFRAWSGASEWTRLLPGFVLEESAADRWKLTAVWTAALAAAVLSRRRGAPSAGGLGLASSALLTAAGAASMLSTSRTGGRDAVRVVDRTALSVRGARLVTGVAAWDPQVLDWGPLYEPHRHPAGAVVGSRLRLPSGRFRLDIDAEILGASAPVLDLWADGAVRAVEAPLDRSAGGLSAAVDVAPGVRAVTLRLRGGSPMVLREMRLTLQPSAPGPGPIDR
ncbi:MAG: hypothetical protein ABW221_03715 [Vicinamibacteria bacterium]